jgi:hypothetical protein
VAGNVQANRQHAPVVKGSNMDDSARASLCTYLHRVYDELNGPLTDANAAIPAS